MEKSLCKIAWGLLAGGALAVFLMHALGIPQPPCLLRLMTGFYCPGCGGTRAVVALLTGHPLRSFLFHPFVPYCAVVGGWFLLSQTAEMLSRGTLPIGMKYRPVYLYIGAAIIVVNWLLRNLMLLV